MISKLRNLIFQSTGNEWRYCAFLQRNIRCTSCDLQLDRWSLMHTTQAWLLM